MHNHTKRPEPAKVSVITEETAELVEWKEDVADLRQEFEAMEKAYRDECGDHLETANSRADLDRAFAWLWAHTPKTITQDLPADLKPIVETSLARSLAAVKARREHAQKQLTVVKADE